MFQKFLEHARDVFFLSAAICLLVIAGLVLRLYWLEEPIQALGKRLLAKDGALLVSILSNERTIRSIRALGAPRNKNKAPRKTAAEYLIDKIVAKDGALLRQMSSHLLQEATIQTSLKQLLKPRPKATTQSGPAPPQPSALVSLGRYAIDQLVARDGKTLKAISRQWMDWLQEQQRKQAIRRKQLSHQGKAAFKQGGLALNQTIERLGRYAIDKLVQKKGALALRLTKQLVKPASKGHTKAQPASQPGFALKPLLEGLGKHAIDRLTLSGARPLRTILQDLLGPEPMRMMRSLRQITQNLSQQIRQQSITTLVKDAAYQLGRGGLETFLLQQQAKQRQQARLKSTIIKMGRRLYPKLRQAHPCFVPAGRGWLSYNKGQVTARLFYLTGQNKQCTVKQCRHRRTELDQHIKKALRPLHKEIDLIDLSLQPSCASLTQPPARRPKAPPKRRAAPRAQAPQRTSPLIRRPTPPRGRSLPAKKPAPPATR